MIESVKLFFTLAGLILGASATWIIMFLRCREIIEKDKATRESLIISANELTKIKDQQIEQLQFENKNLDEDLDKIRDQVQNEIEKRAVAEGKIERIADLEASIKQLSKGREELMAENSRLLSKKSELETINLEERKHAAEKIALLDGAKEQLKMEFQHVAQKIFDDKSQKFVDQNKVNLDGVLNPVREQLNEFKKRIEDVYEKESKDRVTLFNEIINLKTLNQKISEDAINLTNALKGQTKAQGAWGEVILERILEESGLRKGREYESQKSLENDTGKLFRPDVIVHLPDGKDVVIDSKVSLTAYERFCSANTEDGRQKRLKEHIISIKTHIKVLSEKSYEELLGVNTLDFVLLFLPIEGAFWTAVQNDDSLFNDAFEKNIMLVSPSTMLATLRIIQNIWRHEDQNKNALEIAQKAGDLYDKFVGFVDSLLEVGQKLGKAQEAYDRAQGQLANGKGNLIRRTEELKSLGVKAKKALPDSLVDQAKL